MATLYAYNGKPDPERAWQLYSTICARAEQGEIHLFGQLPLLAHQQLLRLIRPQTLDGSMKTRQGGRGSRRRSTAPLSSKAQDPPEATIVPVGRSIQQQRSFTPDKRSEIYSQRAMSLLGQMKVATSLHSQVGTALPEISDYNHVFEHAALTADEPLMEAAWGHLENMPTTAPNSKSYRLRSLFLLNSFESIRQRYQTEGHSRGTTSRNRRQSVAQDEARMAQQARELARQAVGIINEMTSKGLPVDDRIIQYAAKMMAGTNSLRELESLVKTAYGLDLSAPDAGRQGTEEQLSRPITTHLLNTVVNAYGRLSTVSNMVAVYEALRWPLATSQASSPVLGKGGLFSTNFRGLFQDDPSLGSPEDSSPSFAYAEPVRPTSFTFNRLVAQACTVGPLVEELPVPLRREREKRSRGHYLLIARCYMKEALEFYECEVARMRRQLRVQEASTDMKEEDDAATPYFDPPSVTPQVPIFDAYLARAKRLSDRYHVRWTQKLCERAIAAMQEESRILRMAYQQIAASGHEEIRSSTMTTTEDRQDILSRISRQVRYIEQEEDKLHSYLTGRVAVRSASVQTKWKAHLARRAERRTVAAFERSKKAQEEEQMQQEKVLERARAKAQRQAGGAQPIQEQDGQQAVLLAERSV